MIHTVSFQLTLILIFSSQTEGDHETKQLEITAGHVFPLECEQLLPEDTEVSWSWGQKQNSDEDGLPAGMKLRNHLLWFFPAQPSHSGNYSCNFRRKGRKEEKVVNFVISVANRTCPSVKPFPIHLTKGINQLLNCNSGHISKILSLGADFHVTWMKDCSPLPSKGIILQLLSVKESYRGEYTCLLNFTHEGNSYTAAQTLTVSVISGSVPQKPRMVKPHQQETHTVKVGIRHELNCRVFVGTGEDNSEPTMIFWMVNGSYADDISEHIVTGEVSCNSVDNTKYCESTLTILEVQTKFLHIPFTCYILNSKGTSNGTVTLVPSSQSELYCGVALLVAYTVVVLGLLAFHFFKVDLVLAYRKLSPCLKTPSDGKLYDAYVSYLHSSDQSISSATAFALHVLPEVLEDHLGYKLFISGRDDLPGAAVPDVIAATVGKSRRLIIILTSQAFTKPTNSATVGLLQEMSAEHVSINNNKTAIHPAVFCPAQMYGSRWGPYEWWVGLYDALVKEGLQVILVQVGAKVDEAQLPESLRYICCTQGVLHWKQDYSTKPNAKFWKQLRYRMPLAQKAKLGSVV
ncbi:interleukin-1 receptor type 1 [Colossoma macropomum]|uniref:interleukin-1 receptor type 1 n=1 Tax=Colossoma macropomum TaxID=42526 RepID=UPI0018642208|nr:interleukin-1 receptor type 1 [Colossoma macropomum]XP_036417754.1 interleukin-1 receptor type 1 [Colossoma macropomum]